MVLQDADSSADSFTDNPYPSDNDAYTSGAPSGQRYDASILPQPIPILGPLLGFSSGTIRFKTESTLKFAEMRLHRPLTNDEAQALAGHLYKLEQTKSYFTVAGAAAGTYRWYNTWEQCRYPLYKPKPEDINPNKFLFVKGSMAQYARHSWRLFCYVFVAGELGKLVGQITAQPVAAQATSNDPQLAQFAQDLKQSISSDTARIANKSARQIGAEERRAAWEAAAKARSADNSTSVASPQSSWNVRKPTPADDDMSPTAGSEPWPSASENSWGDSAFPSDSPPNTQPQQQQFANTFSQQQKRPTRQDDDDASPTGGMFQDEVQSQSKPGESAWDRLRRGGVPKQQGPPPNRRQPPHQEQREGSTLGDSFAFVGSDDDRRKGRERTQREFDARIEQERQGKDFNEEKRW